MCHAVEKRHVLGIPEAKLAQPAAVKPAVFEQDMSPKGAAQLIKAGTARLLHLASQPITVDERCSHLNQQTAGSGLAAAGGAGQPDDDRLHSLTTVKPAARTMRLSTPSDWSVSAGAWA